MKQRIIILLFFTLLFASCSKQRSVRSKMVQYPDLEGIIKRGKLIASVSQSTTNYFLLHGSAHGFQYEMLKSFANEIGVRLEIVVYKNNAEAFENLMNGKCDIIADRFTESAFLKYFLRFSNPLITKKSVLVQRNPQGWNFMNDVWRRSFMVTSENELGGKTVYIPKNSDYKIYLQDISNKIKRNISIQEVFDINSEELIKKVISGEIEYAVVDGDVAQIYKRMYPSIDIDFEVTSDMPASWVMRKSSSKLDSAINKWFSEIKQTEYFRFTKYKYFDSHWIIQIQDDSYLSLNNSKISRYDELIKKSAAEIGWDWRLLAALIAQESNFNHDTVSRCGAKGIMQLMPETALRFGLDSINTVSQNIRAGAKCLKAIENTLARVVLDPDERKKFVLASYNIGYGHIIDAIRLAKKYKANEQMWDNNAEIYLKNKAFPKYYNDPIVRNGPCKGFETTKLVDEVSERYMHYRNLVTKPINKKK